MDVERRESEAADSKQKLLNQQPVFSYLPKPEDLLPPADLITALSTCGLSPEQISTWYQAQVMQAFEQTRRRLDVQLRIWGLWLLQAYLAAQAERLQGSIIEKTERQISGEKRRATATVSRLAEQGVRAQDTCEHYPDLVKEVLRMSHEAEEWATALTNGLAAVARRAGAAGGYLFGAALVGAAALSGKVAIGLYDLGRGAVTGLGRLIKSPRRAEESPYEDLTDAEKGD